MTDRFTVEATWPTGAGLRGAVVANSIGHRCGYVQVPWWHPWHGVDEDDAVTAPDPSYLHGLTIAEAMQDLGTLPAFLALFSEGGIEALAATIAGQVRIHGGVTFAGAEPADLPGWWLGFDCAHLNDRRDLALMSPSQRAIYEGGPLDDDTGVLWTCDMVCAEVERLAVQVCGLVPNFTPYRQPFEAVFSTGMREMRRDQRRRNRRSHGLVRAA